MANAETHVTIFKCGKTCIKIGKARGNKSTNSFFTIAKRENLNMLILRRVEKGSTCVMRGKTCKTARHGVTCNECEALNYSASYDGNCRLHKRELTYKPDIPTVEHDVAQFVHRLSSKTFLFAKL